MRINLTAKLVFGFLLFIILLSSLSLYSVRVSQRSLQASVGNSSVFLAEEMLTRIDQEINLDIEHLQSYSGHFALQETVVASNQEFEQMMDIQDYLNMRNQDWNSVPKDEITPFMQEIIDNEVSIDLRREFIEFYERTYGYRTYLEIYITNKYGANIAQSGKPTDYRHDYDEWWLKARDTGIYVNDVEFEPCVDAYALSIAVRIDDEIGNFIGITKCIIDYRKIIRETELLATKYSTTELKLITFTGNLIYASKTFSLLEDVSDTDYFKKITSDNGFFIAKEGGKDILFSYAFSNGYRLFIGLNWILVITHDVDEIMTPVNVLRNNIIVFSGIIISIGIFLAIIISRSISTPIVKLTNIVEDISIEHLNADIDPALLHSNDEVGDLATSFNRMITERKRLEEVLIRSERLATLGELAGGVAHELRNPLAAITNAIYFLNIAIEKPDSEVKETLQILEQEVKTSGRIISDLLDFARVKPPHHQEVDINNCIQSALTRAKIPDNIEVESQLDEGLPSLMGDPGQLEQIFGNLLLNAIQAMPDGGNLIVKSELESPECVEVTITDTGVGIPKENKEKVFEPLFTTKAKGIGLGLAIVQALVHGHNGTIAVESEVRNGSTFIIRLPTKKSVL